MLIDRILPDTVGHPSSVEITWTWCSRDWKNNKMRIVPAPVIHPTRIETHWPRCTVDRKNNGMRIVSAPAGCGTTKLSRELNVLNIVRTMTKAGPRARYTGALWVMESRNHDIKIFKFISSESSLQSMYADQKALLPHIHLIRSFTSP